MAQIKYLQDFVNKTKLLLFITSDFLNCEGVLVIAEVSTPEVVISAR